MGFREELEIILNAAPDSRRTLMFSATVPKTILGLTKKYQRNAVRVNTAAEAKQHLDIEYRCMTVASPDKEKAIINVLRFYNAKNAIVFGDTRVAVNRMTQRFNNRGFSVVAISGELSQAERSNALQALRDGRAQVCVATDVAARGIDLPDLELVVHADVPRNREALLHRSGRTGRAGRKGVSALIVAPNRRRNAERLLRDAGIKAEWSEAPSAESIIAKDNERLLENMALDGDITEDEQTLIARLLKAHSPDHIAAAFIRQYRDGQSAPEELLPSTYKPKPGEYGGKERGPRALREDFDDGVWFSINVGRKQRAEPKWILPMLMKSGGLKKGEIGAIKITETKTFVEVAPKGVEGFLDTIGPDGKIEKAITVTQVDGKPDFSAAPKSSYRSRDKDNAPGRTRRKPYGDKRKGGSKDGKWEGSSDRKKGKPKGEKYKDKKTWSEKPVKSEESGFKRKPRKKTHADMPTPPQFNSGQVWVEGKPKKPHKKKLARAAAKAGKKSGKKKGGKPPRK